MKIKVSEASGPVLDWIVAKCEGVATRKLNADEFVAQQAEGNYRYSTDWAQAGPILSRERISRTIDHSGLWIAYWTDGYVEGDEGKKWMQCDRSELVAGLRCYAASKLGEEVEVPDELV